MATIAKIRAELGQESGVETGAPAAGVSVNHITSIKKKGYSLGLVPLAGLVHEPTAGGQFVPGFAARGGLPQDDLLRAKTLKLGDSVESLDTVEASPTSPSVPESSPATVKRSLSSKFQQFEHLPPEQWPDRLPDTPTPPTAKSAERSGREPKGVEPNKSRPGPPAPSPKATSSGVVPPPSRLSAAMPPPPTPPATGKSAMYADGSYWKPLT